MNRNHHHRSELPAPTDRADAARPLAASAGLMGVDPAELSSGPTDGPVRSGGEIDYRPRLWEAWAPVSPRRNSRSVENVLNRLEQWITDAEEAGDNTALAKALRDHATIWRHWAQSYKPGSPEHTAGMMAARRDDIDAPGSSGVNPDDPLDPPCRPGAPTHDRAAAAPG